ncbi:hypothetical protein Tco_1237736 [Tanacetum coccineum]
MIIKKDSEIVKAKVERKSLALKAKKESSDEECSTSGSEDEEYAWRSRDDKNGKSERKCFKCGDPNHLIGESLKPPRDKNQRSFVGGSWSDSGEEDDEKIQDETCLVAQAPNEVCSESSYFSDENSSIDDLALDNEYDKLCKMSLKIITKNKRLKAIRNSLENELRELKDKLSTLEKNKGVDIDCAKCHTLKIENEMLKEESTRLNKFEKEFTTLLNEIILFVEDMILSGMQDNRPPMLDKDLYDSWKSRMELYMQNREHGRMILESVENGPLIWPTVEENGVIRTKKYAELSAAEKIQADCDMKATNIIFQDLPR